MESDQAFRRKRPRVSEDLWSKAESAAAGSGGGGTPSVYDLITSAMLSAEGYKADGEEGPQRFPVVVSRQTRAFLESQAIAMRTSLAALGGLLLDEIVMAAQHRAVSMGGQMNGRGSEGQDVRPGMGQNEHS